MLQWCLCVHVGSAGNVDIFLRRYAKPVATPTNNVVPHVSRFPISKSLVCTLILRNSHQLSDRGHEAASWLHKAGGRPPSCLRHFATLPLYQDACSWPLRFFSTLIMYHAPQFWRTKNNNENKARNHNEKTYDHHHGTTTPITQSGLVATKSERRRRMVETISPLSRTNDEVNSLPNYVKARDLLDHICNQHV